MLLGFMRRFAPFVVDGSKTHTIRAKRKNPPRVGEICHCYVDPRQKSMKLLGRWKCIKVEPVEIYERSHRSFDIVVDSITLTEDERNALAWADGFRNCDRDKAFRLMMAFWMTTHGNAHRKELFVFEGDIIHWQFTAAPGPKPG